MSFSKPPGLGLLTAAAVTVHGYHLGTDDAGIWVPAIKKAADPSLYPGGGEFFLSHAHLSLFPLLVGSVARFTRLPADLVIFLCQIAGIFLLLAAGWRLLSACFEHAYARWSGVTLLAGVLTVPVAGTALPIMDPYVTSRTLSTPLAVFAVAAYLVGRPRRALAWLAACALIHPQMSLYCAALLGLMEISRRRTAPVFALLPLSWFPFAWDLAQPQRGAARAALLSRTYFFVSNWTWYEWFGAIAPLVLLWWGSRIALRGSKPPLRPLLRNLVTFGILFTAAGLLLVSSARLENYNRLQPMRAFQLVYVIFFLAGGALAGEYVLKAVRWRWLALFLPLAAGMWLVARAQYPASPQIEWPGQRERGDWYSAFVWVRHHTPKDAVFALDPGYLLLPGEDMHGFRALAERDALADRVKDSGAVSLFPQLAADWDREVRDQSPWNAFSLPDFERLAERDGVTWVVTSRPAAAGLDCRYKNRGAAVCRIPPDSDSRRSTAMEPVSAARRAGTWSATSATAATAGAANESPIGSAGTR